MDGGGPSRTKVALDGALGEGQDTKSKPLLVNQPSEPESFTREIQEDGEEGAPAEADEGDEDDDWFIDWEKQLYWNNIQQQRIQNS